MVRDGIRTKFGEDHPASRVVGFDADTWTEINQPIRDRVEDRLQNTRFFTDPDAIVKRAKHSSPAREERKRLEPRFRSSANATRS